MDPDNTTISPPNDPSPYIRTYAKDLAAFTGKNPGASVQPLSESRRSRKEKHSRRSADSLITDDQPQKPVDLSILERQAETVEAKKEEENVLAFSADARKPEVPIDLPGLTDGDLVQGTIAAPVANEIEQAIADATEDASEQPKEARENILQRLRAKAKEAPKPTLQKSAFSMMPQQAIREQPLPPQEPSAPLPQPSSLLVVERRSFPSERAASSTSPVTSSAAAPSPIHTYTSDFADRIDTQQTNTFGVLAAEKDAPRAKPPRRRIAILPIIIGILLVVLGGSAAIAGYYFMNAHAPVDLIPTVTSIIAPDARITLSSGNGSLLDALAAQTSQPIPANYVVQAYTSTSSESGTSSADSLLTDFGIPAPDILTRNTAAGSMAGIVHAGDETRPFFILRVSSYERTFAGMLQWESTMPSDLAVLYPAYPSAPSITTTSGSSTAPLTNTNASAQFVDEVVANHNVRALQDGSGRTILLYGYADAQTLLIARDDAAFELLLARLQASNQ